MFSEALKGYNLYVDGLPARKQQVFDMLYAEGESDSQLLLVQDRKTDIFIIESHITGNTYSLKQYNITYKERSDCKDYNPKLAEETNVKTILSAYVKKTSKPIRGIIDVNRLTEILNTFAFTIYQEHEKIEKQADQLYKPI
jgi:hypothetical protein